MAFFEAQLKGEVAPSRETMERLLLLANEVFLRRPWELLQEDQLVMVKSPDSGELCFCMLMGSLGEVVAMLAFVGAQGYRSLRAMQSRSITTGEYRAIQRTLSIEFVERPELKPPDRELLKALGHKLRVGVRTPMFRSARPGYHPWYVTEGEARTLIACARAVLAVCDSLQPYWSKNRYPLVSLDGAKPTIQVTEPPRFPEPILKMPELDSAQIAAMRGFSRRGVFEIDRAYSAAAIGEKNDRKACTSICLAVHAETAIAYPPEVASPEQSNGDVLVIALLNAIQSLDALPQTVRVRSRENKMLLSGLTAALGIQLEIAAKLPAFDFAMEHLLGMFEGR
jgi:hypothetical protein